MTRTPTWEPCQCGEFWCQIHDQHAWECACPAIELWDDLGVDPYREQPSRAILEALLTGGPGG